jgi:hypothetical protein
MKMTKVTAPPAAHPIPGDLHRTEPRWTRDDNNKRWLLDKARIASEKAPKIRMALAVPQLLAHVDRALEVSGMSPAAFGRAVGNHGDLLSTIRDGDRSPRRLLRLRMEDYATGLIAHARERALEVLLSDLGRQGVASVVQRLVDLLDARDGDADLEGPDLGGLHFGRQARLLPKHREAAIALMTEDDEGVDDDLELNGDEKDGVASEDDFWPHSNSLAGPGCPIADPCTGIEDDPCGCDPEEDYGPEERGEMTSAEWPAKCLSGYDRDQDRDGDLDTRPISDPAAVAEHKAYLRGARCEQTYYRSFGTGMRVPDGWRLLEPDDAPSARVLLNREGGVLSSPRP